MPAGPEPEVAQIGARKCDGGFPFHLPEFLVLGIASRLQREGLRRALAGGQSRFDERGFHGIGLDMNEDGKSVLEYGKSCKGNETRIGPVGRSLPRPVQGVLQQHIVGTGFVAPGHMCGSIGAPSADLDVFTGNNNKTSVRMTHRRKPFHENSVCGVRLDVPAYASCFVSHHVDQAAALFEEQQTLTM